MKRHGTCPDQGILEVKFCLEEQAGTSIHAFIHLPKAYLRIVSPTKILSLTHSLTHSLALPLSHIRLQRGNEDIVNSEEFCSVSAATIHERI